MNTSRFYDYVGPIPDISLYQPDHKMPAKRQELLEWHKEQQENGYVFNFRNEILAYCDNDVRILRKACVAFRHLYLTMNEFCPFSNAITVCLTCNSKFIIIT